MYKMSDDEDSRVNEATKRERALSSKSIDRACKSFCTAVRNCDACSNNRMCRNLFNVTDGPRFIRELRSAIWERVPLDPKASTKDCAMTYGIRKRNLANMMKGLMVLNPLEKQTPGGPTHTLKYSINGVVVCKSFFKVSSSTLL
jgi:hypothetical protein